MVTGVYYSLTYGAAALFAGIISDNFNRKRLLIVFGMFWNLTSYGNMFAHSYSMLAAMRMMFGLFSAFSSPISYSLIADYFPPLKRTLANACFTAASFFGIAFATLSEVLVGSIGWRLTYFCCGTYGLAAVIFVSIFLKEPERGRYDPKKESQQKLVS